jgi:hypothetical protein
MVLKNIFAAIVCTMLLASSGLSMADEYRAEEFLGLDLSKAVLSPKPLGPPTQFAPVPVEAKADSGSQAAQAPVEPKANPRMAVSRTSVPRTRVAHVRADKPRGAARTELARRHGNPLDAQALDTRIQVWPCKSGGICNWQRQGN